MVPARGHHLSARAPWCSGGGVVLLIFGADARSPRASALKGRGLAHAVCDITDRSVVSPRSRRPLSCRR
jgi:hypothetical protein